VSATSANPYLNLWLETQTPNVSTNVRSFISSSAFMLVFYPTACTVVQLLQHAFGIH
jgi:hypothetical protein